MADEIDALMTEIAPGLKDAVQDTPQPGNQPSPSSEGVAENDGDDFDPSEYENESDDNFDPDKATPEQKKAWPKKFQNALSRRDKELNRLRAIERAQTQKPAAPAQAAAPGAEGGTKTNYSTEQQARIDAANAKKPQLEKFADYGEYIEALTDWKTDVRDVVRDINGEIREAQRETETQNNKIAAENEARITKQSKELIEKHPEYLELVKANADILASFDQLPNVLNAFGGAQNPELAFLSMAQTPGALQALARMDAQQAVGYVAQHEVEGRKMVTQDGGAGEQPAPEPQRSKAPAPMKAARGAKSGTKSMDQMDADELDEVLGLSEM